jgi:hypothetical protein
MARRHADAAPWRRDPRVCDRARHPARDHLAGDDRHRLRSMWFRRLVDVAFVVAIVLGAIVLILAVLAGT